MCHEASALACWVARLYKEDKVFYIKLKIASIKLAGSCGLRGK